jgi:hypothetical protein
MIDEKREETAYQSTRLLNDGSEKSSQLRSQD